ncbi:MAG: branched-chain amino acid transport system substrate-binding protein [Mycobacterium sp.]|nr:branched-chain amino acid transport system substrate-binding protein [Mycobacterium sp.]
MSYESTAEPIKVGYLMDFRLPELYPQEMKDDLSQPFDLVFDEAIKDGQIDRPIEVVYREVEGLPKGSVKAVVDAFGELVDEGCLVVFGPHITRRMVRSWAAARPVARTQGSTRAAGCTPRRAPSS